MLLDRLDTTPGQDKAIRSALSDAFARLRDVREPLRELRTELAAAIQHDEFDRGQVDALFTRGEGRLRDARAAVIEAIERIHAALDSEQRKQLGKLLGDSGWSGFRNW
jgi:Spy/CpxP family protein refolding chaperone